MSSPRLAVCALLFIIIAGGAYYSFFRHASRRLTSPPQLEKVLPKEFLAAMNSSKDGPAGATVKPVDKAINPDEPVIIFIGNGMVQMRVTVKNTGRKQVGFVLQPGEIYENPKNRVVLLEGCDRQVSPGSMIEVDLRTAATSSSNAPDDTPYAKSSAMVPQLDALIQKAQSHPDTTQAALQTAILSLVENPAVDTFAKFPRLHGGSPAGSGNFKVDTADIISAMQLLSAAGVTDRIASSDPQLEIEAMIDPKSHDVAMHYYGITPEMEWTYWKHELLEGNPGTRHYALYGIARYFPDVALVMLPKWAMEPKLSPIFRLSAVRALALTNRPAAIAILRKLDQQFGSNTDLHESADRAEKYLDARFAQSS